MDVTYKTYSKDKMDVLNRIGDWKCYTSPMNEYGIYHKEYVGPKGTFYEVMSPVWEKAEAEVELHGVKVKIAQDVKFMRIEYWSDIDANSKYYYEKW